METRTIKWAWAELPPLSCGADIDAALATYTVKAEMVECEIVHSDETTDTIRRPDGQLMALPKRVCF